MAHPALLFNDLNRLLLSLHSMMNKHSVSDLADPLQGQKMERIFFHLDNQIWRGMETRDETFGISVS